jgi:hypothetical protein
MALVISPWIIFGGSLLFIFILVIGFFILMAQGIIRRTDTTVKIEKTIEDLIGGFFRIFLSKLGGSYVASQIENNQLKFKCIHCGYLDDINRQFCPNCCKNDDGFYIENVLPYKCKHCFNRSEHHFEYCPKCKKNNEGHFKTRYFN